MSGTDNPGHEHSAEGTPGDCADFLEQMIYFIDNELDEASCEMVRHHLDTCHPCLEKYDLQRTVKSLVARSCSEPAPSDLRERVLLRIRQVKVEVRGDS